jgi:hypothetical protein
MSCHGIDDELPVSVVELGFLEQFNTCSLHQNLIYFGSVPQIMKSSNTIQSQGL